MTAKRSTSKLKQPPSKVTVTPPAAPATKGERTRAALLDAAKRLFVSNGLSRHVDAEIADEAGLAVGGIYNHFRQQGRHLCGGAG